MRKSLSIILLLALSASTAFGQTRLLSPFGSTRQSRKALSAENFQLKNRLDSLQEIIDSLRDREAAEEEVFAVDGNEVSSMEYTTEVSDSLLHLWYRNSLSGDFDNAVNEYNMDSVRFSSNVSDEEMMRRLAEMNSFIQLPFNDNVKNYIILYSERLPSKMGRVMGLSNYYFPIFEQILNRYGLPLELKYVAVIESMLNPVATSRAGAKGIWQFMYNTARGYGLEINSFVDERMDVEKSMDAAARYLRDSYKVFGDWSLAISSYNCGAGNVSKAIKRAGGNRDFWSIYPYLPRETRGYVPAFVGAMYAMTYWREYGIVPQNVGMPAQTDTFEIRHNLHFDQINAVVGIPKEDLQSLNPQYFHEIIPGSDKPYILKLPYTWTNAFVEADKDTLYAYRADSLFSEKVLKEVTSSKGSRTSSSSRSSSSAGKITYKVRSGDYLGKIASRYGVTVNQLKSWNNLHSTALRVGQTLVIYPKGTSAPKATTSSSSSSSKSNSSTTTTTSSGSGKTVTYTVKSGDSLYNIAKLYPGVSVDDIKRVNALKSDKISAGQKLKIQLP